MLIARYVVSVLLGCMIFIYNLPMAASQPAGAEAFVVSFGNNVFQVLASKSSQKEKQKQFKTLFSSNTDIDTIAQFTLGKYASSLDVSERREFGTLLEEFIAKVFIGRMSDIKGTAIEVLRTQEKKPGKDYLVQTIAKIEGQSPVRVNWRVYKNKGGNFRLFDISIEGLWLAQEQRSTFVDIIGKNKGNLKVLFDHLRR